MPPKQTIFPLHGDPDFAGKISKLEEYRMFATDPITKLDSKEAFEEKVQSACSGFEKTLYQHMMQHYLSRRSPYRSILLFHGLGVGKTCSSITIAESFLLDHTQSMPPRILVVSPIALRRSYEDQIFSTSKYLESVVQQNPEILKNQCTSDTYAHLIHGNPAKELFLRRVQALIRSRYEFITYDSLVNYVAANTKVTDMVIIVDEAHNLRHQETEKKAAEALEKLLDNGERNRLVLLSATPMYNEPDEIIWLLQLLLRNDKRQMKLPSTLFKKDGTLETKNAKIIQQLAQEYISYIRGKNPFAFAARISPVVSGYPILGDTWAQHIDDGIVVSNIGTKQKDGGVIDESEAVKIGSSPKQLQWLNITYPGGTHGEKGFDKMFDRVGNPFPVVYRPTQMNKLMPSPGQLETCASKFAKVCDIIRNSQGIVLIYSQFVWSGVIPLAIALEHLGFKRYGATDLLSSPSLVPNPVNYQNVKLPHYCILSGDANVMGSSKIETLRRVINSKENLHGEKIKVVLITPIAGEGLSFQNVREVHIMDPWYHMNRIEQVIGRAIRTCSHTLLPPEERNVTVFLHACVGSGKKDTADIHAYKIAARKWKQTKEVEALIRDYAIDCAIHYHLNYLPKSLFNFEMMMRTSQNKLSPYHFGDAEEYKPACGYIGDSKHKTSDDRTMRTQAYISLLPTAIQRMEKYIITKLKDRVYFTLDELVKTSRMNDHIIYEALERLAVFPNKWISTYECHFHKGGIVFVQRNELSPQIEIPLVRTTVDTYLDKDTSEAQSSSNKCDPSSLLKSVPISADLDVTLLMTYMMLDSACWSDVAEYMIENQLTDPTVQLLLPLIANTGAFIVKKELPRLPSRHDKYIGYVDIFNKDDFKAFVYDTNENKYRAATDNEIRQLKEKRKRWTKPAADVLYGVMEPFKFSKSPEAPYRSTLKLMLPGPTVGKRRGVVCTSNKKHELATWLSELGDKKTESASKEQMCFTIAVKLLKANRLLMYPEWKP